MASPSRLQTWLTQQLASGLPALAGARVSLHVPVQVGLVNELIAEVLDEARAGAAPGRSGGDAPVDMATLARLVRQVRVDATPGVITLDVEAGVDG
jgi:hypothetical protein